MNNRANYNMERINPSVTFDSLTDFSINTNFTDHMLRSNENSILSFNHSRPDSCWNIRYADRDDPWTLDRSSDLVDELSFDRFDFNDIDDKDAEEIDPNGWMYKREEEWSKTDTIGWLIWAGIGSGHLYRRMSRAFVMPGKELLRLSRNDFVNYDPYFGDLLYGLLHEFDNQEDFVNYGNPIESKSDDEVSPESGSDSSKEKVIKKSESIKKRRGRPQGSNAVTKSVNLKIWEFVMSLLRDRKYCPSIICWENYEKKTFRFVESDTVAKLWGARKSDRKNPTMNFDKFSRALRYHYIKKVLQGVYKQRLVYQFSENATGLELDDYPNFDPNYYENLKKLEI